MSKVFIIAEAGVNHNGSLDIAKRLIYAAADAGADAVKFQTFKAERIVSIHAPKAEYQKLTTGEKGSQFKMIKDLEMDCKSHKELIRQSRKRGIMFLSSPFDFESIDLLDKLRLNIFKIPSGEITNLPYLRKIGRLNKKVLLSTGMADLGEIEDAINVLIDAGTDREDITVLHCSTEYPASYEDVNLLAMLTIKDAFKVSVGYSDHTQGIELPVAAAAIGAEVIEKHLTLDRRMKGPDHKASLEPDEFARMIKAVRNIEKAFGNGIKKPSKSEFKNIPIVRKSIVAKRPINKGEIFTEENTTVKRPGTGISPMRWNDIIGTEAPKDYKEDELL